MARQRYAEELREGVRTMILSAELTDVEIARRSGVSRYFVYAERQLLETADGGNGSKRRSGLAAGEKHLKRPVRCLGCGHRVQILPCRICRAQQAAHGARVAQKLRQTNLPFADVPFADGAELAKPQQVQVCGRFSSLLSRFKP